jgi:heme/copper-type cytochrome/quinol oxidase subunit 4
MSGFVVLEWLEQAGYRLSSSLTATVFETLMTGFFCSSVRVKTVVIPDKK